MAAGLPFPPPQQSALRRAVATIRQERRITPLVRGRVAWGGRGRGCRGEGGTWAMSVKPLGRGKPHTGPTSQPQPVCCACAWSDVTLCRRLLGRQWPWGGTSIATAALRASGRGPGPWCGQQQAGGTEGVRHCRCAVCSQGAHLPLPCVTATPTVPATRVARLYQSTLFLSGLAFGVGFIPLFPCR